MTNRFLPGVPGREIEEVFNVAPGNEIKNGKFDNPASSAALVANTFGFFLKRARELPPLPDCGREVWPARSLSLEATVRFPWSGGRHPVLDCLVTTPSALIGIESKRFEPFRGKKPASFSDAYWRPCWGGRMKGYEAVRDKLQKNGCLYACLDSAQLVKHAFALRTAVNRQRGEHCGLTPILFYLYAEPAAWPKDGKPISTSEKAGHREEIECFARDVTGDEVIFIACSYQRLLEDWTRKGDAEIRTHADAISHHFSP
ncbi:MAG: hypothetical protein OXC18_00295 [Desulfurellaceae bacterium]|nr:hypothetical protein [Desulfurellaceae bacterium]